MAVAKRLGKKSQDPDDAALDGFAEATTANNAALAGAWIPALVFGIPGDSVTAIVIGVLLMKNVKPGPEIFEKQAVLVYSLYIIFILANLILVPIGLSGDQGRRLRRPRSAEGAAADHPVCLRRRFVCDQRTRL